MDVLNESAKTNTLREYLSLGDIHQHGEAGQVITLTADVAVVSVQHLAAFRRPAACPCDPKHQHNRQEKCRDLHHCTF